MIAHIESKNGQVNDISFTASIGRGRGWLYSEGFFSGSMWGSLVVMVTANSDRFEFRRGHLKEYVSREAIKTGQQIEPGSGGIIVEKPNLDTPGGGEALEVYLSTGATSATARSAFDLNLRCLTALHACTKLCEVMPSAWSYYTEFQKSNGWWAEEPNDCPPSTFH